MSINKLQGILYDGNLASYIMIGKRHRKDTAASEKIFYNQQF